MGARFLKLTLFAIAVALLSSGWAQPSKIIEVASIKPSRQAIAESNLDSVRGKLTATNITVRYLIRLAYGVKDYQIERAPGWIDSEQYDVVAKSANRTTAGLEEEKSMVRELLADRFQLTTHRETKQMAVYSLVVDKSGPKLTPHNDWTGARTRRACGHLAGTRLTMDVFATVLSREFESDVFNRTALSGKFS
jgi:uncharacterized protein (TIGR03435 family)